MSDVLITPCYSHRTERRQCHSQGLPSRQSLAHPCRVWPWQQRVQAPRWRIALLERILTAPLTPCNSGDGLVAARHLKVCCSRKAAAPFMQPASLDTPLPCASTLVTLPPFTTPRWVAVRRPCSRCGAVQALFTHALLSHTHGCTHRTYPHSVSSLASSL